MTFKVWYNETGYYNTLTAEYPQHIVDQYLDDGSFALPPDGSVLLRVLAGVAYNAQYASDHPFSINTPVVEWNICYAWSRSDGNPVVDLQSVPVVSGVLHPQPMFYNPAPGWTDDPVYQVPYADHAGMGFSSTRRTTESARNPFPWQFRTKSLNPGGAAGDYTAATYWVRALFEVPE